MSDRILKVLNFLCVGLATVSFGVMITVIAPKFIKYFNTPQVVTLDFVTQEKPTVIETQKKISSDEALTAKKNTETVQLVELNEKNFVVLHEAFTDESVNKVMRELQTLSNDLPKEATIYLVLNSPGGSVDAGNSLITFCKGLPQKIKTISIFSASMAFQTAQNLDERLVLPNSVMMSHRAKFGISGEARGEMFKRINFIMTQLDELDQTASSRMKIGFDDYQKLIADEYWVYGRNAVKENAADRLILAKCSKEITEKTNFIGVETMFGTFQVEVSKCPLIPGIISVRSPEEMTKDSLNYVKEMFTNKKQFVEDYVLTTKWEKFQKVF